MILSLVPDSVLHSADQNGRRLSPHVRDLREKGLQGQRDAPVHDTRTDPRALASAFMPTITPRIHLHSPVTGGIPHHLNRGAVLLRVLTKSNVFSSISPLKPHHTLSAVYRGESRIRQVKCLLGGPL